MAIFSRGKYSTLKSSGPRKMIIPDGSWVKCKYCSQTLYTDRLADTLQVCWNCGAHLPMTAPDRIAMLSDEGKFVEMFIEDTFRVKGFIETADAGLCLVDCVGNVCSISGCALDIPAEKRGWLAVLSGAGMPVRKSVKNAARWYSESILAIE